MELRRAVSCLFQSSPCRRAAGIAAEQTYRLALLFVAGDAFWRQVFLRSDEHRVLKGVIFSRSRSHREISPAITARPCTARIAAN